MTKDILDRHEKQARILRLEQPLLRRKPAAQSKAADRFPPVDALIARLAGEHLQTAA